jgi:hypothetical protein
MALFGALIVIGFVVHIFHYLVIAAVILGIGYVVLRASGMKALSGNRRKTLP